MHSPFQPIYKFHFRLTETGTGTEKNTGTRHPERWSMPHPWKHSRSGWMGLWATSLSWRCPCSLQGSWT